jgi:hypothetical protein
LKAAFTSKHTVDFYNCDVHDGCGVDDGLDDNTNVVLLINDEFDIHNNLEFANLFKFFIYSTVTELTLGHIPSQLSQRK